MATPPSDLHPSLPDDLADLLVPLARRAGQAILEIYTDPEADFELDRKDDDSPLTKADLASDRVIDQGLAEATPQLPILSEESKAIPYDQRQDWNTFWLVDPLDGTKEFIKRNGEFTVNIALIHQGRPVAGVVHAPDLDTTYYGEPGRRAWMEVGQGERTPLDVEVPEDGVPLRVVVSRSHLNDETQAFVDALGREVELVPSGSSLKFCRIAEAEAHVYPRLAPTMEWDTGAAQAVLEAAGGAVLRADDRAPLAYNKQDLLNPHFIATADPALLP